MRCQQVWLRLSKVFCFAWLSDWRTRPVDLISILSCAFFSLLFLCYLKPPWTLNCYYCPTTAHFKLPFTLRWKKLEYFTFPPWSHPPALFLFNRMVVYLNFALFLAKSIIQVIIKWQFIWVWVSELNLFFEKILSTFINFFYRVGFFPEKFSVTFLFKKISRSGE